MNRIVAAAAALIAVLLCVPHANAQLAVAKVVATCGTVSPTPVAGTTYPLTMDVTGTLCSEGGGGGGGGAVTPGAGSAGLAATDANAFTVTLSGPTIAAWSSPCTLPSNYGSYALFQCLLTVANGPALVQAESGGVATSIVQASGVGAAISIGSAGMSQVGPNAVGGKQVVVSAWNVMSATTNSFQFGYGPTGCASMTAITGAYSLSSTNPGLTAGDGLGVLFATPTNTALCVNVVASGTPSIAGHVSLTQQ